MQPTALQLDEEYLGRWLVQKWHTIEVHTAVVRGTKSYIIDRKNMVRLGSRFSTASLYFFEAFDVVFQWSALMGRS